jgi:hypothetical protein
MSNLAVTYQNQDRFKEAEQLEMQVLGARKRMLGDHPDILQSMNNLATYQSQGRLKEGSGRVDLGGKQPTPVKTTLKAKMTGRRMRWCTIQ